MSVKCALGGGNNLRCSIVKPLEGLRVIDMATILAGQGAARYLGDFGATVIKVEAPGGDDLRRMGWLDDQTGDSLFWRITGRNKHPVELDLKSAEGRTVFDRLLSGADVLIENLRPGKLEALGYGPADLRQANRGLVVLRVSGFGQDGPYRDRPGFATLAEAISGLASITGDDSGPPLLPPLALTDETTGLAGAFAVMVALYERQRSGVGQVIDVSLLDTMLQLLGALPAAWVTDGFLQGRMGSSLPYSVPRGTFECADGRFIALSASSNSVAVRLLRLVGVGDLPGVADFAGRVAHRSQIDVAIAAWAAQRTQADALAELGAADCAAAPVYGIDEMVADPHIRARVSMPIVDGVAMPAPVARLDRTPGGIDRAGAPPDSSGRLIRESDDPWAAVEAVDRAAGGHGGES